MKIRPLTIFSTQTSAKCTDAVIIRIFGLCNYIAANKVHIINTDIKSAFLYPKETQGKLMRKFITPYLKLLLITELFLRTSSEFHILFFTLNIFSSIIDAGVRFINSF